MADTDALCRAMQKVDGVEYRALVPNIKGVQRAFDAGLTKAKLTVSASEAHCLANFNSTPVKMVEGFADCVEFAATNNMALSGAISTSFGCPFIGKVPVEMVENVVRSFVKLGITELSLSDTTGMANPRQVFEVGSHMTRGLPRGPVGAASPQHARHGAGQHRRGHAGRHPDVRRRLRRPRRLSLRAGRLGQRADRRRHPHAARDGDRHRRRPAESHGHGPSRRPDSSGTTPGARCSRPAASRISSRRSPRPRTTGSRAGDRGGQRSRDKRKGRKAHAFRPCLFLASA